MTEYEFLTTWCLEAPRERVWDAIWEAERWPEWWRGVVARGALVEGDETGVGQVGRYTWRSRLPYDLEFEMTTTRVHKPHLLEGQAKGELAGHRALAAVRAERGGRCAGDRGGLRVERQHHQALDEPAGPDRAPAVRVEPRLGDAKRRPRASPGCSAAACWPPIECLESDRLRVV